MLDSRIRRIKVNKLAIFLYLLMFFSNDTYLFGTNSNSLYLTIARYSMILWCALLVVYGGFKLDLNKNRAKFSAFLFMVLIFLIVGIVNNEFTNFLIIKILCMATALLICVYVTFEDFARAFNSVIYFIAICSLLLEVVAYISPALVRMLPSMVNTADVKYYTFFLAGLDSRTLGTAFVRASGIFWEPGVYQMFLNIAIMFELMILQEKRRKRLAVYILALVATFSTTGIIVFAWIIATYLLFFNKERVSKGKSILVFIGLFILAGVFLSFGESSLFWQVVFGKFSSTFTTNGTSMVRLAGIVTNIEILLDHPLTGVGVQNIASEFLQRTMASSLFVGWTEQNTNTLLFQFAAHGALFGIPFTIGTFKFSKWFSEKKIMIASVFVAICLLYIGENLQYSTLPYLIIFYGYGFEDVKRERRIAGSV